MAQELTSLSASWILGIPLAEPERLFSRDEATAKRESRKLASFWHPDRNKDVQATEVLQWIQRLFSAAEEKRAAGTWETPGLRVIQDVRGATFELAFARRHTVDIGTLYVGRSVFAFEVAAADMDLAEAALDQLKSLTYATPEMQQEFARYFPTLLRRVDTATGCVLVFQKTQDLLLLQDVLTHFKGKMPPRHVAWIISRLLNIACYLERQAKVAHNGIGLDSVFISPQHHSATLFGGWWFATGLGQPLRALSGTAATYAPPDILRKKQGDSRMDVELIKALGRTLLGDATGVKLATDSAVPSALVNWLDLSSSQDAVSTFKNWQSRVLLDAFGQRRFEELALSHTDIYI